MSSNATRYATLLHNIADRARDALREGAPADRCEILVRLYNDYLAHLRDRSEEDLSAFDSVGWEPDDSPEVGLTEVMIRADHLACWLTADVPQARRFRFDVPPLPSMSGVVDREKIESFSRDMQQWAHSVSERAVQLSQELSREIPERISHYFGDVAAQRPDRAGCEAGQTSWRREVLKRVQDGDLSADEALRLLEMRRPSTRREEDGEDDDEDDGGRGE